MDETVENNLSEAMSEIRLLRIENKYLKEELKVKEEVEELRRKLDNFTTIFWTQENKIASLESRVIALELTK